MGNPEMYVDLAPEFTESGRPVIKFTNDDDANELLANDPNALLIAIVLDQQITTNKAFSGPRDLKQRLGHLDPAQIAEMDEDEFLTIFREKPAIHRFPASMGKRVQAACATVRDEFDNNAENIWDNQPDAKTIMKRLGGVPGVGPAKQKIAILLLARYYGMDIPGWRDVIPVELPD